MVLEDVKPMVHAAECLTDDEEPAIAGGIKELKRKKKLIELEHRERALKEMLSLRHTSSSSSSSDRTTSRERKARSKWSLRRHIEDRKDVK